MRSVPTRASSFGITRTKKTESRAGSLLFFTFRKLYWKLSFNSAILTTQGSILPILLEKRAGVFSMKCPSCGAETSGKFCEYCGSEMPKEKVVGKCPKCGDANVSFKRERVGTATQSRSHKNAFGNGRNGHSVSQTAYRTVGICQSCGYTWNPNGGSQRSGKKTWLWVLGWICIFPLPLTILMLRKKNMKPAVKYGIIAVAWLLFFAIGSSGNSETDTTQNNVPAPTEIVQVEQATTATTEAVPETTENDSPWAKQEENIRRFVSQFNEISDTPVKEIGFRNNHTIAYFIADGFSITNIQVNDHDDMGCILRRPTAAGAVANGS